MKNRFLIALFLCLAAVPAFATTGIKNWSTTAGSNNSAPPAGAPEGMAPSAVNDVMRQIMAEVRSWYENREWVDLGTSGLTYVDASNFRVTGDLTSQFVVNRRVRAIGTTPFTIYGTISVSAFNSPNTQVTVVWDSGTLDNTLSEVAIGPALTNKPYSSGGLTWVNASVPDAALVTAPSVIPTGVVFPYAGTTAPSGYLLVSGNTIGDGSSGGTARANADTSALYTLLWGSFANTQLPIQDSSGAASTRGANAAADFAAHKRLPLLDLRGRVVAGLDNMGGTTAGRLTATTILGTTIGNTGGSETHTLTVAEVPALTVAIPYFDSGSLPGGPHNVGTSDFSNTTHNANTTGGGGAHSVVQPTLVLPYIIKL